MEDQIRQRLKDFKSEEGVSYKYIAKILNIRLGAFYDFTSDSRPLPASDLTNLDYFLKERGY